MCTCVDVCRNICADEWIACLGMCMSLGVGMWGDGSIEMRAFDSFPCARGHKLFFTKLFFDPCELSRTSGAAV